MVLGMNSGRNGVSRRPNTQSRTSRDKQESPSQTVILPQPSLKHKPSAEQVHIARMLTDDRTPDDMEKRVSQVQAVVDSPEESIFIALHDNEFDVGKACEALLDNTFKEEWTTMSNTKKNKKKIVNEQQQQKRSYNNSKSTSKAAILHTQRNYGGSVSVIDSTDRRNKGVIRHQPSGYRGGRIPRQRGERKKEDTNIDTVQQKRSQPVIEELWDDNNNNDNVTMVTDTPDHNYCSPSPPSCEEWVIVVTPPTSFPEALGRYTQNDNISTTSSLNDVTLSNTELITEKPKTKQRKFKVSEIPECPVEMPCGIIDTLTHDMSVLGIDFGFETTPITPPLFDKIDSPVSHTSYDQHTLDKSITTTTNNDSPLLSTSPFADIADDPVIISSYKEKPPDNLEPPPGLIHPSKHVDTQPPLLPPPPQPISLPLTTTAPQSAYESHPVDVSTSFPVSGLHSSVNSSYSVAASVTTPSSQSYPNTVIPMSTVANIPLQSGGPVSLSGGGPVSLSGGGPVSLSGGPVSLGGGGPVSLSGGGPVSLSGGPVSRSANVTSSHLSSGKIHSGNNVHPMTAATGMVYPHLLPQFPSPYGSTPVMMPSYTYDVETMNRYPGYFSQHPTSQDQVGGASITAGLGRDPQAGNAIGTYAPDNKYDNNTTTAQQQQQQQQGSIQQQQQQQMNAFYSHYPNLLYPLYPHMGMAAATGYTTQPITTHKPTGGTSYPSGTTYPSNQYYPDDDYAKMIAASLNKSNQVPSTTSADYSAYSKHQFDTKGNATPYNNYLPMGTPHIGNYIMGHHVPPMGTTPVINHDTANRNKSHKYNTTGGGWPGGGSTHT